MTQPPDYVARPYQPVHGSLPSSYQWEGMSQNELETLRNRLIESIIQVVVQAITGFFFPGGGFGGAATQLTEWATSIAGQAISAIESIVEALTGIVGGGADLLGPLSWLFPGLIGNGDGTLSSILDGLFNDNGDGTWSFIEDGIHTLLDGGDGTLGSPIDFLKSLLGLSGTFQASVGTQHTLIETLFGPVFDPLEALLLAPSQQALDIINSIWDAFDTGIFGNTATNPIESVFNAIFGIFGTGTNAQAVNVIQDSRLDALVGGGSALSDAFDGAASTALNSAKWNQVYSGSGSGTCGLSGDGFCKWNTSGSSARICYNVFKTATTTDTQSVALGLGANIASNSGSDSAIVLFGRSDLATNNQVVAVITDSTAEIGYVLSNTYTRLGAAATLTTDTNGTWQFKLGTTASNREFVLLRNGSTVISRTDTGAASLLDASHRYSGFAMQAGWNFSIFFGFPVQVAPPPVGAWAASDRDPAS